MPSKRQRYYCTGCGLCGSLGKASLEYDEKGFLHPVSGDDKWLSKICPCEGLHTKTMSKSLWGRSRGYYYGWSTDRQVRKHASSGGVLTELCSYLLQEKIVDYIIQTTKDPNDPTQTISVLSSTREQVIGCAGSRYSISHPLDILGTIDLAKKYAFVGKPCDVIVLKNFLGINQEYKKAIVFTFSFFCAGLPSKHAQTNLLEALGCTKEECVSLTYRGVGWPGYTTVQTVYNKKLKMDYESSWGKILGRDIMPMCRFCIDGLGESADISCGDGWYLSEDGAPDFTEHEGRNIIVSRTVEGDNLIKDLFSSGLIEIKEVDGAEKELNYIQHFQRERKQTMVAKRVAMTVMFRAFPAYPASLLFGWSKGAELLQLWWTFKGTVKRIMLGKI